MGGGVTIRLEVYLPFRGQRIWRGDERLPVGLRAGQLLAHLGLAEPELTVLVGGRHVSPETPLRDGDEVAILRHAEGGA